MNGQALTSPTKLETILPWSRKRQERRPLTRVRLKTWTPTHRHKKGGFYRVVGHGVLEAERIPAIIYEDIDGTVWIRAAEEFNDGRFTKLKP